MVDQMFQFLGRFFDPSVFLENLGSDLIAAIIVAVVTAVIALRSRARRNSYRLAYSVTRVIDHLASIVSQSPNDISAEKELNYLGFLADQFKAEIEIAQQLDGVSAKAIEASEEFLHGVREMAKRIDGAERRSAKYFHFFIKVCQLAEVAVRTLGHGYMRERIDNVYVLFLADELGGEAPTRRRIF